MNELQDLIKTLLQLSAQEVSGDWKKHSQKIDSQDDLIEKIRELALKQNTILGRIVKFPHADSHAMYIITKINKRTVQLTWLDYMDGWVDDRCGKLCTINYAYADNHVKYQDKLREIFSSKKNPKVF